MQGRAASSSRMAGGPEEGSQSERAVEKGGARPWAVATHGRKGSSESRREARSRREGEKGSWESIGEQRSVLARPAAEALGGVWEAGGAAMAVALSCCAILYTRSFSTSRVKGS